jgi:hypothetical protein
MIERHRTLPDGTVLSLYEQVFNWKITRSSPESWPIFWDGAY